MKSKIKMDTARDSLTQSMKRRILEDLENALKFAIGVKFTDSALIKDAKRAFHEERAVRGAMEKVIASRTKSKNLHRYLHHDNRRKTENALSGKTNENFRSTLNMKARREKRTPILEKAKEIETIMADLKGRRLSDVATTVNVDGYAQTFDFGKYNVDIDRLNEEQGAGRGAAGDTVLSHSKLRRKVNALKKECKLQKAKCKKYKENYQRLKRKLEKKPYDQRLNGQTLATRERVREHADHYAKLVAKIKEIQHRMGKSTNSLADRL